MTFDHDKERMLHDLAEMRERSYREIGETMKVIDAAQTPLELCTALMESPAMQQGLPRLKAMLEHIDKMMPTLPFPCPRCGGVNVKLTGVGDQINYFICRECKEAFNKPRRVA